MNEKITDRTYLIKKKIEQIIDDDWQEEKPVVTVHEGKIGKERLVHVSNGLQRTLDSYTDENVKLGYIAFDVIVNPLAYRKYETLDSIANIAYDKFIKLRRLS